MCDGNTLHTQDDKGGGGNTRPGIPTILIAMLIADSLVTTIIKKSFMSVGKKGTIFVPPIFICPNDFLYFPNSRLVQQSFAAYRKNQAG